MDITLRAGDYKNYFSGLDLIPQNNWQIYFFTSLNTSWVLYHATIQDGILITQKVQNHPDIIHTVFGVKAGMNLIFQQMILELGVQYISPEFNNGTAHRWVI